MGPRTCNAVRSVEYAPGKRGSSDIAHVGWKNEDKQGEDRSASHPPAPLTLTRLDF